MEESRKEMLEKAEDKKTALQMIAESYKVSKAKDVAIVCLTAAVVIIGIGMAEEQE